MRKMQLYQALLTIVGGSLTSGIASAQEIAQAVYYGGSIPTMAGDAPAYVEALAIKDGKIVFAGSKDQALAMTDDTT
jgi:hypothetical protein